MILSLLMYMLFALMFILAKQSLEYAPIAFLVGSRMVGSALLLLLYLKFFSKNNSKFSKKEWIIIALIGISNIYLTNILEYFGLMHLSAAKACFIYSLSPYLSAIFSFWIFGERISWKKFFSMIIAFLGLSFIFLEGKNGGDIIEEFMIFSWGELALLGATVFTVLGWILVKVIMRSEKHSYLMVNGWSMLIGGIFSLVQSLIFESWSPSIIAEGKVWQCIKLIIEIAFISNIVCYNIYGYLLKKYSATFLSLTGGVTPLFAALFGWLILNETVGIHFWLASSFVFPALFIFNSEELKSTKSSL